MAKIHIEKEYKTCKFSVLFFDINDVIRTSIVDDGYGDWDDEDAEQVSGAL